MRYLLIIVMLLLTACSFISKKDKVKRRYLPKDVVVEPGDKFL